MSVHYDLHINSGEISADELRIFNGESNPTPEFLNLITEAEYRLIVEQKPLGEELAKKFADYQQKLDIHHEEQNKHWCETFDKIRHLPSIYLGSDEQWGEDYAPEWDVLRVSFMLGDKVISDELINEFIAKLLEHDLVCGRIDDLVNFLRKNIGKQAIIVG